MPVPEELQETPLLPHPPTHKNVAFAVLYSGICGLIILNSVLLAENSSDLFYITSMFVLGYFLSFIPVYKSLSTDAYKIHKADFMFLFYIIAYLIVSYTLLTLEIIFGLHLDRRSTKFIVCIIYIVPLSIACLTMTVVIGRVLRQEMLHN